MSLTHIEVQDEGGQGGQGRVVLSGIKLVLLLRAVSLKGVDEWNHPVRCKTVL